MTTTKIDTRKLDMIFFMAFETNTNLTYEQIENLNQIDKIDEIEDTGKIDESLGLESIEESSEQEGISIPEETDASENIDGVGISSDEEIQLPDLNAGSFDEISETDANI